MFEFIDLKSLEPVDNKYRPLRYHSSLNQVINDDE